MKSKQSQGVFLLGVGAQKAGTSWLHQQLGARLDTDFGFLKEYHIFDALYHPEYACFKPKQPKPWKWRTWQRNRFINNPDRYFDYFAKKLSRKKICLTGDITPSYACLTAKTYQLIRNSFNCDGWREWSGFDGKLARTQSCAICIAIGCHPMAMAMGLSIQGIARSKAWTYTLTRSASVCRLKV